MTLSKARLYRSEAFALMLEARERGLPSDEHSQAKRLRWLDEWLFKNDRKSPDPLVVPATPQPQPEANGAT